MNNTHRGCNVKSFWTDTRLVLAFQFFEHTYLLKHLHYTIKKWDVESWATFKEKLSLGANSFPLRVAFIFIPRHTIVAGYYGFTLVVRESVHLSAHPSYVRPYVHPSIRSNEMGVM